MLKPTAQIIVGNSLMNHDHPVTLKIKGVCRFLGLSTNTTQITSNSGQYIYMYTLVYPSA